MLYIPKNVFCTARDCLKYISIFRRDRSVLFLDDVTSYNARKVICSCEYSADILKPVLQSGIRKQE